MSELAGVWLRLSPDSDIRLQAKQREQGKGSQLSTPLMSSDPSHCEWQALTYHQQLLLFLNRV